MDWPDKKNNNQKQPPDKKNKPKYILKEQATSNSSARPAPPAEKKQEQHHQHGFNNNYRNKYERNERREEEPERPRFIEKNSSHDQHSLTCLICSEGIRPKDGIWTCYSCYISLHLKCIRQWINKTNEKKNEVKKNFLLNWSCIQCKTEYNENMPEYYCFCGKYKNPDTERDLEPHSCGKPCQRKRGQFCPHLCPDLCHSGKCRPCELEGVAVKCNCGKSERMVKCSEDRAVFQCGKRCEKMLGCKKHKCERNCHNGDCFPCKKKHLVKCFCGKNDDVVDCAQNVFACDEVCDKLLSCGYHKCESTCHEGPCGPCFKTPELQKTCHCGRYQLMMITETDRESCRDPIASCGMPCKKKLSCGHQCALICHEGRCGNCKVSVQQQCRCGSTHRKVECWKTKATKEEFICDNVCKKKRNCGIHVCNTECCKFRNYIGPESHQCELTCQKSLNCQKHTCDMPCHAGLCKKCPVIYSQPQPCPCGATSMRPPIVCGTITPECDNLCNKKMACGHLCSNLCHYGPCRCRQQVMVTCRCKGSQIQTICGREALCLNKCQKILQCGHKCLIQCHAGSCEEANKDGCFKKCEKDREDCGHKCKQICHSGKKCEEYPCQAEILIKCECGHRQTSILCGSQGKSEGNQKKKQIVCNSKCQNMKRFDILYKGKQIYYPNALIHFGFKNFVYLQKLEERLQKFISESDSYFVQIEFKQIGDHGAKTALHNLFQNHYHLNTHFYRHMKTASFTLTQTQHTMMPKPCLSQYIKEVGKGLIKRTNLPFEYTIRFDGEVRDKVDIILRSLKDYMHKYYVERKDRMVYVHFWNREDGVDAKADLEAMNQTMYFYGEENVTNIQELEEPIDMNQIIQTQFQQKKEIQASGQKVQEVNPVAEPIEQKNKDAQISTNQETPKCQETPTANEQKKEQQVKKQAKQGEQKPKIIFKAAKQSSSKLIIRKGGPNFIRSQYPPSSQNVQDIYTMDEDELYGDSVDWDQVLKDLLDKKMGIQASQWRIRCLVMISLFHQIPENLFRGDLVRILDMYEKDKEKAKRILQLQRLDVKRIQEEMKGNQIYLSDHEPEIVSYAILYNNFAKDKIELNISDECAETREVQQSLEIIKQVQETNWQQFFSEFKNSGYLLACMLVPFVHEIRQLFLKQIGKQKLRIPADNLFKYLLFDSEEEMLEFCKRNGIIIAKRMSKSKKLEQYGYVEGELAKQYARDDKFIEKVSEKRTKGYFLEEPKELVDGKWMTRSFFAFGDFKESMSSKYMLNLCRKLREIE